MGFLTAASRHPWPWNLGTLELGRPIKHLQPWQPEQAIRCSSLFPPDKRLCSLALPVTHKMSLVTSVLKILFFYVCVYECGYICIYMCICLGLCLCVICLCMCVYVYLCVYVYMYMRTSLYVCICICVCMCAYVCMCIGIYVDVFVYVYCVCVYMYMCDVFVCVRICVYVCVYVHVYLCVCVCVTCVPGTCRGQKRRTSDSLKLGLQSIVNHWPWVLGSKLGSSGRARSTLSHGKRLSIPTEECS